MGSSVGEQQMCVVESRVSEGCSASQRLIPATSPVESVPIIQSRKEKRATSVSSMVCSAFWNFIYTKTNSKHHHWSNSCLAVSTLRYVQPTVPVPLPQRCHLLQNEAKLHLYVQTWLHRKWTQLYRYLSLHSNRISNLFVYSSN